MAAGEFRTAMIVAAESENCNDTVPVERLGIRETASAIILDAQPSAGKGFSRFLFNCNTDLLSAYTTYYTPSEPNPYLHVEKDRDLEALYIDCIVRAVWELLQLEQLDLNRIDTVFPPQVSSGFITRLSETLHLPREKFVDVVGEGHDLFSSSLPYALEHALTNGLVKPGDTGLMISVGSGIQVGCAIYHF